MLEWFRKQPVDEEGKMELPKAYTGELEKEQEEQQIASEVWKLTALRAILQMNKEDKREDFWDE